MLETTTPPTPATPLRPPRSGPGRRAFNIALLLLPIGVLGNIAFTLLATDRSLLRSLGELPRMYLLAALVLTIIPWVTGGLRLLIWTRFLGYRIPARDLLRMTLVVDVGSALSPTAVGGEAFKWGLLVQHGVRPGTAASIALLPKLEDGFFFLCALPAAIVITASWRLPVVVDSARLLSGNIVTVLITAAAVTFAAWLAARAVLGGYIGARLQAAASDAWSGVRGRVGRARTDAGAAFRLIARDGRSRLALTMLLTAVHWLARYSVVSAVALFLGVPFDPVLFWLLQWVVFTIMSFIPTPGAAGGAELAFTAVYATLLPAGSIGIATAAWRMFTFYVPAALAALAFALLPGGTHRTAPDLPETTEGR